MKQNPLLLFKWRDALDLKIRTEYRSPVISNYQLAIELIQLIQKGEYMGRQLRKPSRPVDRRLLYEARNALLKRALLVVDRSLPNTILKFSDRKEADPTEILCAIDPFGYIAYFSAMTYHGLTNRLPRVLYMVTPDQSTWSSLAKEKMAKDLGDYLVEFKNQSLPELRHTQLEKLGGMIVEKFRTKELGGWRNVRDGAIRVTTLGRTFLHMVQRPELCGGIRHVIDIYEEHAKSNLGTIIAELTQHGKKVDRVRVGYILEEYCKITDSRINEWTKDASRGGSRKLDAQTEYAPKFSEKWSLSINV